MAYEQHRFEPITAEDVRMAARSLGGEAGFFDFHGEWSSASEILNLMARYLTGRAFLPELIYGPEREETSVLTSLFRQKNWQRQYSVIPNGFSDISGFSHFIG